MAATFKPPKPRVRLRRAETAERLLDGAFDAFAEMGFEAATIEDICRRVGMTRGAFYSSFKTKEELFQALFALQMKRLTERLQRLWSGIDRHPSPLAAAVERYIATELHDGRWHRLLTEHRQLAARSPSSTRPFDELTDQFAVKLGERIERLLSICGRRPALPAGEVAAAWSALVEAANWRAELDPRGAEAFLREMLPRLLLSCSVES